MNFWLDIRLLGWCLFFYLHAWILKVRILWLVNTYMSHSKKLTRRVKKKVITRTFSKNCELKSGEMLMWFSKDNWILNSEKYGIESEFFLTLVLDICGLFNFSVFTFDFLK